MKAALFLLGAVLAVWAVWQVAHHIGYGYAQGPFEDRNVFVALMNLLWFPAAFVLLTVKKSRYHFRLFAISMALFMISTGLFATTSRGGIASWVLLCPVFLWAAYRNGQGRKRMALLVLLVLLVLLALRRGATNSDTLLLLNLPPRRCKARRRTLSAAPWPASAAESTPRPSSTPSG